MSRELVTVTDSNIEKAQRMLFGLKGAAPRALSASINRGIQNARANVVREIRKEYTAGAGDIRRTIKLSRSTPKRLEAVITSSGSTLPLSSFSVRPMTVSGRRRTPVRVSVKRGGGQALQRAFILRPGGRPNVFERVSSSRLPIRRLFGPSVPQMLGNESVVKRVGDLAQQTMETRLDHEINRILNGIGAR